MCIFESYKEGRGVYHVKVFYGGKCTTQHADSLCNFASAQEAYDCHYERWSRTGEHNSWNICYALQGYLEEVNIMLLPPKNFES